MKKITITIPKDGGKWKFSKEEGGITFRKNVTLLFEKIERYINKEFADISSRVGIDKMAVIIKDGQSTINKSCNSFNPRYLLWITACFLENHLKESFLKSRYKLYRNNEPKLIS